MNNRTILFVAIVVNVLILVGITFFVYLKFYAKPAAGSPEDVTKLLNEVGKVIELPTGEQPTVATISDISKLQSQPAFAKAKNGDKVIIYQQAGEAIIYDPNSKKIVQVVSTTNTSTPSAQQAPQNASASAAPK